jgi:FtsP/CotA-like multicopper oxidase with cupredoxin domain
MLFSIATEHPFHLHGHQFAVIETGLFSESLTEDDLRKTPRNLQLKRNPVYKDTVLIPRRGFVRLRVRTQTANFLFFHCHYDFHLQVGMAGVLQVGDIHSMPKLPRNFPQCRDYIPK